MCIRDRYNDLEYNNILVPACAQAGIAAFTGDGTNPEVFTAAAAAIGANGGKGIPTVKPWDRDTLYAKLDAAKASGAKVFAMDIDAAGLPFLKAVSYTHLLGKWLAGLERRRLGHRGISPLVDKLSLGAYNRKFAPNRTGADWISRDEAQVDAYLADPYCQYQSTVSMFEAMMGGLQYIAKKENLSQMCIRDSRYPHAPGDREHHEGYGVRRQERFKRGAGRAARSL